MARSFAKVIVHSVYSLEPPRWGYGSLWQRYPGLRKRSQSSHSPGHPACWVAWAGLGSSLRDCNKNADGTEQTETCSSAHVASPHA